MAAAPTTGQPVVQLNEGGFLSKIAEGVNKIPGMMAEAGMFRNPPEKAASITGKPAGGVDIQMDSPEFQEAIKGLTPEGVEDALKLFGGPAGVVKRDRELENGLRDVMTGREATPAKIAAKTLELAGVPDTPEGRMDFAETLGFDTNDIGALDDKIMEVLMSGQSTELQQAVLVGLQNYKSTAMARAAAGTGSSSFTKDRTALRAYQDTLDSLTRSLSDRDLPPDYEGTVADYAAEQALKQVLQTYPTNQIPPQLLNQAGGQPRRPETPAGGLETFLIEAQKINPDSSVEELTEFYTKKYGG
jgi:hypothetical protein